MLCHGVGRIEVRGTPLHVDTLEGIRVVAHPKLVEVGQDTVTGTSSSSAAGLNQHVGILGADAFEHFVQAAMVFNVYVRLFVLGQIGRAIVFQLHIGIPFDIGNLRMLAEQIVYDAEHEILNFGITYVEQHLCTAPSVLQGPSFDLQSPVGMLFEEFALAVYGFRLYPDAEFDAVPISRLDEVLKSVRQFLPVYYPVSQGRIVLYAAVFVAEPSVVHDEQFAA